MYSCGLALIKAPLNKLFPRIIASLKEAKLCIKHVLYIKVYKSNDDNLALNSNHDDFSFVSNVYWAASSHVPDLDVRVLLRDKLSVFKHQPDILLSNYDQNDSQITSIIGHLNHIPYKKISDHDNHEHGYIRCDQSKLIEYDHTCLGGTFDGLHNGHKILLSEAIVRSRKSITIGVTDVNMIKNKILWELIKPVQERQNLVKDFVVDIFDDIDYKIVPINDPFGPAIEDSSLECIVVSEETKRGGDKINEIRKEKNMNLLQIVSIQLVASTDRQSQFEEDKLSSSTRRIRMLGSLIKPPNPYSGKGAYIIGLTGGIASGKSSICKKLSSLGAFTINADTVAHETYQCAGAPAYNKLIDSFGKEILGSDLRVDRRKLGDMVFSDKEKLNLLNSIIWPETADAVKRIILEMQNKHQVIVVEAALLLEANWHTSGVFHQIWVSIIPPEEAIKRLKERNNLTEEAAKKRITNQLDNWTRVQSANMVFSTMWDFNFTHVQVEKAWNSLKEFVDLKN